MQGSYLGNYFSNQEIKVALDNLGAKYLELSDDDIIENTADTTGLRIERSVINIFIEIW